MHSQTASKSASIERGRGIRGALSTLLLAAAVCGVLAVSAGSASAATPGLSYGYQGDIGTFSGPPPFQTYSQITADSNGNTFLSNQAGGYVDVLEPSGVSVAQFTNASGFFAPSALAVSPDGSTVYAVDMFSQFFGSPAIQKFTRSGSSPPVYTQDTSWTPSQQFDAGGIFGLAVDPSTGDLLVGAGSVYRFDGTTGALLGSFDGTTTELGRFSARGIAVAPDRDVYVIAGPGRVEHMGPDGAWKGELKVPAVEAFFAPTGISVDPQNGDVAVELLQHQETVIKIYTSTNELKETVRVLPTLANGNTGLAFSADGTRLEVATNEGIAHVFGLGTQPGVDPPVASEVTSTGVRLTATVATGGEASTARMEYCLASDPACEKYLVSLSSDPSAPDYSPEASSDPWVRLEEHTGLSSPTSDTISDEVSGLEVNTRYLARTWAVNDAGRAEGISAIESFRTALAPPEVQTGAAGSVTEASAELAGTINPLGDQTTYYFEYGPTTSYGNRAPVGSAAIAGAGRTPRTFTQAIKGLASATVYHYRIVATNSAGMVAVGADRAFTTAAAGLLRQRAYEEVSAPDKEGLSLYANFGFQVEANGNAFVYSAQAAAAGAQSASQASRYLSVREPTGWSGQTPLDPPLGTTRAILFSSVQAVSSDGGHALVVTQRALTPDAVEGAANLYVTDVKAGTYQLVGTATENTAFSGMVGPNQLKTYVAGAPDFSWLILNSRFPLLPGAPQSALYRWTTDGGLSVVSLLGTDTLPTGDVSPTVTGTSLVSQDGQTIAFSLQGGQEGVYGRSGGQTTPISVAQYAGGPSGTQPGVAVGVSGDGRFIFFYSAEQLTEDATDPVRKLYRYDSDATTEPLEYLGPLQAGEVVRMHISRDGNTVYFNGPSEYLVWRDGHRHVVYPDLLASALNASASPEGDYLEFLAGNRFGNEQSVYLYDAAAEEERCISCSADGESSGLVQIGATPERDLNNDFPRLVTDDGQAFFSTSAALLGTDHNTTSDVYEYSDGRLTLLSPGDQEFAATVAGISENGDDVFFTTAQGLVPKDVDGNYDVYDARVGGGFAEPPIQNECSGEACRGATEAPSRATIGSRAGKAAGVKAASGITRVKPLTAAERARLARGGKAHLKVILARPGTLRVTGTARLGGKKATVIRSSVKPKRAGQVSVPLLLSKGALSRLRAHGSLSIRLAVHLAGEQPKVSKLKLKATGTKRRNS